MSDENTPQETQPTSIPEISGTTPVYTFTGHTGADNSIVVGPIDPTSTETINAADEWRSQQRKEIEAQVRQEATQQLDEARKELEAKLQDQNRVALEKFMADMKKELTPPTHDEIQQMLDAEYLEFNVKVKLNGKAETVTLNELPASYERKFVRMVQDKLTHRMADFSKLILDVVTEPSDEGKVNAFWAAADPVADVLHETVAMILTRATGRPITAEQIEENLSLDRQIVIIRAQMDLNRVRDFFSHVSRLFKR